MRSFALFAFAAIASLGYTRIDYTATVVLPDKLWIQIKLPIQSTTTQFQIPNFAPGHYVLLNSPGDVKEVSATGPGGVEAQVTKVDSNTYSVETPARGLLTFRYLKPARISDGAFLWQGPYEYMYAVGRKQEACTLTLKGPEGFQFAVSLDPTGENKYSAPNYDVLADCPVSAGDLLVDSYMAAGKPHSISLYGAAKSDVDRTKLASICKRLTEEQMNFFGGAPYKRYLWHFGVNDAPDGAGGLEHLNSTNIRLASGLGPGAVSVLSHEFFHLWNVKRIRSRPLGPFDYLSIPKTGALWWLEGVTDYYADVFLARSGVVPGYDFGQAIIDNMRTTRNNPNRLKISPYDASYRVGEAAGGRGNSQGYLVNYYNTGWLLGFCFDSEIRSRTLGKRSLDDVMRALYKLCENDKPGFAEDEIRNQLIRVGGPELGAAYDAWVMSPGELPVEEQLAKMGWEIVERQSYTPDLGFTATPSRIEEGMRLSSISPAANEKLKADDVLMELNGESCTGKSVRSIRQGYEAGLAKCSYKVPSLAKVRRGTETLNVSLNVTPIARTIPVVRPMLVQVPAFAAARIGWLD